MGTNRKFRRRTRREKLKQIEKLQKESVTVEGGTVMTLDKLLMRLGQKDAQIFEYEMALGEAQHKIQELEASNAALQKAVEALQVKPDVVAEINDELRKEEADAIPEPAEGKESEASQR